MNVSETFYAARPEPSMGILTKLFDGADGIRETMRESYEKHRRMAADRSDQTPSDTSPHQQGLYGALGSRYKARGDERTEPYIWMELVPFLLMEKDESVEAISELAVFQEMRDSARIGWLRTRVNDALHRPPEADEHLRELADFGTYPGLSWRSLLDSESKRILKEQEEGSL